MPFGRQRNRTTKDRSGSRAGARLGALRSWTAAAVRHTPEAVTALMLLGAAGAMVVGFEPMQARVGQAVKKPVRVEFQWPPLAAAPHPRGSSKLATPAGDPDRPSTWLSEPSQQELVHLAERTLGDDPFDPDSLSRTGEALMSTGWFRRVDSIRRKSDGVVSISALWRAPAAVARRDGTDYLVAADGVRLPPEYAPGRAGPSMRVILGAAFAAPAQPGEPWVGGDVQAGLTLLATLRSLPAALAQTRAIDVSAYSTRKQLVIVTDQDRRVVWGASPGDFQPAEPTTKQKLAWLADLLTSPDFGRRIDAQQPMVLLTNPRGIVIDRSAPPPPAPDAAPSADAGEGEQSAADDAAGDRTPGLSRPAPIVETLAVRARPAAPARGPDGEVPE
jgi:hypothetical protein